MIKEPKQMGEKFPRMIMELKQVGEKLPRMIEEPKQVGEKFPQDETASRAATNLETTRGVFHVIIMDGITDQDGSDSILDKQRAKAVLFLVMAALLWSSGGFLIKSIHWNPLAIAGMRSGIAALLMLAVKRNLKFTWSFSQLGGALAYAGTVILFVVANKYTTAANAILLQYTAPVYVALLGGWFLGEPSNRWDWLTIGAVIGGMSLFFIDKLTLAGFWGNICAALSGIAFAAMVLFLRKQKAESPLESVILGNLLTALLGIPFMLQSMPDGNSWISLACLGIFQLGFSYLLFTEAMKHVTALQGILIPIIEPVLNPIWVFLFLGERPGRLAIVGGVLILGAVTARCVATIYQPGTKEISSRRP